MKNIREYQKLFGTDIATRALHRLDAGSIILDDSPPDSRDWYTYKVEGNPNLLDWQEKYVVRIKKDLTSPRQLEEPENACCSCKPHHNHCSHILACQFYRISMEPPVDAKILISEEFDVGSYDFKFDINGDGEIFLSQKENHLGRKPFIGLSKEWRNHFSYRAADKTFVLKIKKWSYLLKAVEFLESQCNAFIDMELFRNYLNASASDGGKAKKRDTIKEAETTIEEGAVAQSPRDIFEKGFQLKGKISKYIAPVVFYTLYLKSDHITKVTDPAEELVISKKLPIFPASIMRDALGKLIERITKHKMNFIIVADSFKDAKEISLNLGIPLLRADTSKKDVETIINKMREVFGAVAFELDWGGPYFPNLDVVIEIVPSRQDVMLMQKRERDIGYIRKKKPMFYIQFVLEGRKIDDDWAKTEYDNFMKSNAFDDRVLARRKIIYSVDDVKLGIRRTIKATEQRRLDLIKQGEETEQTLLEFLKANQNAYIYMIAKKDIV